MSERWVRDCKKILDQIEKLGEVEELDRLDLLRTIRFNLLAVERSVYGWMAWIDNLDVMASFSIEELKEMSRNLAKLSKLFIEYDCEITSISQKDLTIREPEITSGTVENPKDKTNVFYIK